eukprot:6902831-Prorocentrum_lima.AAC.1
MEACRIFNTRRFWPATLSDCPALQAPPLLQAPEGCTPWASLARRLPPAPLKIQSSHEASYKDY